MIVTYGQTQVDILKNSLEIILMSALSSVYCLPVVVVGTSSLCKMWVDGTGHLMAN